MLARTRVSVSAYVCNVSMCVHVGVYVRHLYVLAHSRENSVNVCVRASTCVCMYVRICVRVIMLTVYSQTAECIYALEGHDDSVQCLVLVVPESRAKGKRRAGMFFVAKAIFNGIKWVLSCKAPP